MSHFVWDFVIMISKILKSNIYVSIICYCYILLELLFYEISYSIYVKIIKQYFAIEKNIIIKNKTNIITYLNNPQ